MEKQMSFLYEKYKEFIPKYVNKVGNEVEMKKDGAKLVTSYGSTILIINEGTQVQMDKLNETSVDVLRAAIYQTQLSTDELKKVHERLKEEFKEAQKRLMNQFIKNNYSYKKIDRKSVV